MLQFPPKRRSLLAINPRHLVPVIASVWRDLHRSAVAHDRDVMHVLDCLEEFYDILDSESYAFEASDQAKFEGLLDEMLTAYHALNMEAVSLGQRRWHEVPKHHYAQHVGLQSRYYNPRWGWCYPDEDFMRILKAAVG